MWLKWLMGGGIYALLWLPWALYWSLVGLETGALSHEELLLLPPVVFCATPLSVLVRKSHAQGINPFLYLALTLGTSAVLLGIFALLAKAALAEYFLDHPAPVLWLQAMTLALAPPISLAISIATRKLSGARPGA